MKKDRKIKDLILSAIADKSRIKKAFTNVIVVFGGVAVIVLLADMIMVALEEVKAICWWIVENKTVVGWVLGIICVTLVGGYWVGKDDDIDDEGSRSSDDEAPINCMEEDKLNRGAFVLMLAETLQRLQANHSAAFFGLYAPCGDGKTSVVRLLKEYVKTNDNEKIAFVDFSPWMYIDQDNIGWKFWLLEAMRKMG